MIQTELIAQEVTAEGYFDLGSGHVLHLPLGPRHHGDLYFQGNFIKRVNLADKSEKRIFVVELLQKDINQTRLAEVLNLSRQTLHNYRESYRMFGITGLLHGYSPSQSKSDDVQRRIHVNQRRPGSKARELEAMRRANKAKISNEKQDDLAWDGKFDAIYTLQETAIDDVLPSAPAQITTPQPAQPEVPAIPEQSAPTTVAEEHTVDDLALDGKAEAIYTLQETAIDNVLPSAPTQITTPHLDQPEVPSIPEQSAPPTVAEEHTVVDASFSNASTTDAIPDNNHDTNQSDTATPPPSTVNEKVSEIPYADNHGWEANRYAGIFSMIMMLIGQSQWLHRIFRLFGNAWRIMMVFVFMVVSDTPSIEQMKHIRQDEVGRLLGLKRLPALDTLWTWFHAAADLRRSPILLREFFAHQIRNGIVSIRFWFTDGHALPYTGQESVHATWSTQRRMPIPGQTNMVTCDTKGRIVAFDIEEGHGDLRARILSLGKYAQGQSLGTLPIHVFDREGDGAEFFSELVQSKTPFITWEKNANHEKLIALKEADFTDSIEINGTHYKLLEQVKTYTYQPKTVADAEQPEAVADAKQPKTVGDAEQPEAVADAKQPEHRFDLRRVVMLNMRTSQRVSVLCGDAGLQLSMRDIAFGMLNRWGMSENTFKHIQTRHPYHYHPGFGLSKSEKQDIANPQIKVLEKQITTIENKLAKYYYKHSKAKPSLKQDGSERMNSLHKRLTDAIAAEEALLKKLKDDKAKLPKRIDVSGLADYKSFNVIDNEGKNLFDFVTTSVWNARRQLLDWLDDMYAKDQDRVDLLYAIFNCQGWIRSDDRWVVVRLEPLQQPARRYAQEQLCRKLMGLGSRIPGGKWLRIEVGDSPL